MERIYKDIVKQCPQALAYHRILCDDTGNVVDYEFLDVNPAFERLLGLKGSDIIGKRVTEVLPGITGSKLAKDKLEESETRFRQLFDTMTSGAAIYEVKNQGVSGKDYIIKDFNNTALQIEGMSKEEVIGKSLMELRPNIDEYGLIPVFQQVWETGEPAFFPSKVYADGKYYNWYENRVYKIPSGEIVAIYDDVTERQRAAEALFAEKERWKITLHSIGDGVITTDKDGRITMLNKVAQELTGWTLEEALKKPLIEVFDIINEYTREPCENPTEKVLKHGVTVGLAKHTTLRSKSGLERSIADSAAPIKDQKGEILGVVMVFRDVTEERKREEEIIYLSYHDRLTGLYNRAFFEEELMRQDAKGQLPLSLIMGDVNGLKISNDVFGHQEGDRMLQAIAEVLKEPVEPRMFWLDGEATNSSFCCPELRIKLRRQSVSE